FETLPFLVQAIEQAGELARLPLILCEQQPHRISGVSQATRRIDPGGQRKADRAHSAAPLHASHGLEGADPRTIAPGEQVEAPPDQPPVLVLERSDIDRKSVV